MNEVYQNIANRIVEQAAADYRRALCGLHRHTVRKDTIMFNKRLYGPLLMKRLKNEVVKNDYKLENRKK